MDKVTGPVTGGSHGWAFGASMTDLVALGYVEEEYFLDGDATLYSLAEGTEYTPDGCWDVTERGTVPFGTRFVVRRPLDAGRFNGIVVVGWNNVSIGHENLGAPMDAVIASGAAFVGASVQKIGVHGSPFGEPRGLVAWDAERYGSRSIPDDDASFDIFSRIAAAVGPDRDTSSVDPMGGLAVRQLIAYGASQSANRLATYLNTIQPLTGTFDGFMLVVYSGGGTRVDARGPGPSLPQIPPEAREIVNLLPFGSHLLRDDLDAKVLVFNSETEATWYLPVRQADSDQYRLWEVAGTAHAGGSGRSEIEAVMQRDFGDAPLLPIDIPSQPNANTVSYGPPLEAAFEHLERWLADGVVPPPQDRLAFTGDPPRIARDGAGNALGGIRLPDLEVPTGTHVGESADGVPDLTGTSTPFSDEQLRERYPDRAAYVTRHDDAVTAAIERGALLERHRDALHREAVDAPLP